MKNRLLSADLLKAVSIFGVVFIHGASLLGCASDYSLYISNLFRFGVPCFIVVWAYFFEKSFAHKTERQRWIYIRQRFIHLFTVFFIWSLAYFLILADWENLTVIKIITTHFSGYGWSGQYYFIVIFQLILLYPFLRFCYSKKILRYIIIAISTALYVIYGYYYSMLPDVIHALGDRPFILWVLYVFTGIAIARNTIQYNTIQYNTIRIFINNFYNPIRILRVRLF